MHWDESVWLVEELLTDPSAHITAAVVGWDYAVSWEFIVLADTYDLAASSANRRNKRALRPWKSAEGGRRGRTDLAPTDARAALARNAGRG